MFLATRLAGLWQHGRVARAGRRVTRPLIKKPGVPGGFVPIPYPNALAQASRRLADIQLRHGDAAIALVGDGPAPTTVSVESRVLLLAGSTLGGMVQLLVESGQIDVEVIADGVPGMPDAALRRIDDPLELIREIDSGALKGLVSVCYDPPGVRLARALDELEFHLAVDTVLGRVARRADIVLPLTAARAADRSMRGVARERDEPVA